MISEKRKYPKTLMQRRKTAIIALIVAIALLIPSAVFVSFLVKTYPYYDTDGTKYWLKYRSGEFALYDTDGNRLAKDPEYGYFVTDSGTLVSVDASSGAVKEIIIPDTEDGEVNNEDYPTRLMIFPHLPKDKIMAIDVVNSEGSFTFHRYNPITEKVDAKSDFVIKEAPFATFDQQKFATLYVDAGYTIVTQKIQDPIKDRESGEYYEYGLAPETRVDEDGNEYEYLPAYYIVTDTDGNRHKIIVGDELVDGSGYYVQYVDISGETEVKRDAVYVLGTTVGSTMLAPVEDFVSPTLVYPMTLNTYLTVRNFLATQRDDTQGDGRRDLVGFSFVSEEDRKGTILESYSYRFGLDSFGGYLPDPDDVQICLENIYQTDVEGVVKLAPTNDDLVKYGLAVESVDADGKKTYEYESEYSISFDYDVLDENEKYSTTIRQVVLISEPNEDGNYYTYTLVYDGTSDANEFLYSFDMVLEVKGYAFDFLNWDAHRWINGRFMSLPIPYCEEIKVEAPSYWAQFILDNSESVQEEKLNTNNLKVNASSSKGESFTTFSGLSAIDRSGNVWTVTPSDIKVVSATGAELHPSNSYYVKNALGRSVKVLTAPIICNDGSTVEVNGDTVVVTEPGGKSTTYLRYGTTLFRNLYETLIVSEIEGSYDMSEEEENALTSDESKLLMTVTIKNTEGETNVYKLYRLTSRKAYLTINGNGGFYVNSSRVQKILNDVERFMENEPIDHTSKK